MGPWGAHGRARRPLTGRRPLQPTPRGSARARLVPSWRRRRHRRDFPASTTAGLRLPSGRTFSGTFAEGCQSSRGATRRRAHGLPFVRASSRGKSAGGSNGGPRPDSAGRESGWGPATELGCGHLVSPAPFVSTLIATFGPPRRAEHGGGLSSPPPGRQFRAAGRARDQPLRLGRQSLAPVGYAARPDMRRTGHRTWERLAMRSDFRGYRAGGSRQGAVNFPAYRAAPAHRVPALFFRGTECAFARCRATCQRGTAPSLGAASPHSRASPPSSVPAATLRRPPGRASRQSRDPPPRELVRPFS
jgi:hypothetical protein